MRILVAGATGAIGRRLVPRLVDGGHEVFGMVRASGKRTAVADLGALPVVADALNAEQVAEAVAQAEPEVIIDELLAALDSQPPPPAPLLIAEVADEPWAALSLTGDRRVVANPFHHTAELVTLLRARADGLAQPGRRSHTLPAPTASVVSS